VTAAVLALLFASPLAAPPASPAASPKPPAAATPAPAPAKAAASFELLVSEALIGALVTSMMPYDAVMEQEVGAFGITKTVTVNVHLTNPRVKVTAQGVKVTLDYTTDGAINKAGVAVPTMTLTPIPSRGIIEGRLVKSGVMLPGGIELPLEDLVEPIEIPAVIPQEIEAGDKVIAAEARMTEVILEEGRVRVRGDATFKPAK
jgi:hypothetical protein